MVFQKRYNRYAAKKRVYKRPAKYGKRPRLASRAILTNIVDTVVRRNAELKYVIYSNSSPAVTGSYVLDMLGVAQGSTDSDRVGDKLTLNSVLVKYGLYDDSTAVAATSVNFCRVMLVQWLPNMGSAPVIGDILQTTSVTSPINHDKRQMMVVLMDRTHKLMGGTNDGYMFHKFYTRFRKHKGVQFSAGSTNGTNKIYLIVVWKNSGVGKTGQCASDCKITYFDS